MKQFFKVIQQAIEKAEPKPPLACDTNSTFVYASGSDVQKTWRRYGWTPPSEYRNDYEFGKNRGITNG